MAELEQGQPVSLQELIISTLATTDALAKLLIEKGVITDAEFKQKLLEERAVYQRILNPTAQELPSHNAISYMLRAMPLLLYRAKGHQQLWTADHREVTGES